MRSPLAECFEFVQLRKVRILVRTKICEVVGYQGRLVFDHSKPDGTPRKVLDSNMIRSFGWRPTVALDQGIQVTYQDFLNRTGSEPVLQK